MPNIIVNSENQILDFKQLVFFGGELSVKLDVHNHKFWYAAKHKYTIHCKAVNAQDLFELALLKDAIERVDINAVIDLYLPYVPYARQDRVCDKGESFSLKVLGNFINSLKFNTVTVVDPHSDVTGAVIDRLSVLTQANIFNFETPIKQRVMKGGVLFCSPDSGANKKTSQLAGYFDHIKFIRADKLRDLSNGKIKETIVYADDLTGIDVMIADDICDGGRTFIELAKVLKAKNARKVLLYVTHGIFSQGLSPLYDGGIDEIYTTDSFGGVYPRDPYILPNGTETTLTIVPLTPFINK